jgi:hypothetical protein
MNGQNALEAMWNQIHPSSPAFTFALQYYGALTTPPLGYLVLMIDGLFDQLQSPPYSYWELLYNGQPSTLGIDDLQLNDGDQIEFTYTTSSGLEPGSTWKSAKVKAGQRAETAG